MGGKFKIAKRLLRGGVDIVWPARSIVSNQRGVGRGPLTAEEFSAIHFLTGAVCDRCGVPLPIDIGEVQICVPCMARPPRWNRARAAMIYDETSRRAVFDLKRSGRRDGIAVLSRWMEQAGQELLNDAAIIVPVPLHYRRLVKRGYNQSGWLAQAIARRSGVTVSVDALKRTRNTPSQGGQSAKARRRNVAAAFKARKSRLDLLNGKKVLLIDDVLTTGATVGACVRALKAAGAAQVDVLVLARVVRETDITI